MNFLAANARNLAVCGRHNVYVYPTTALTMNSPAPLVSKRAFTHLDLLDHLPPGSKRLGNKICVVTVAVSEDGRYVAASDSAKNVYVFELTGTTWDLFASWEMEKRVTRLLFDRRTTFVVMSDKTGDVWVSYMSLKLIRTPKKVLGHSSFILDLAISEENDEILTCDRDEKIRISSFPDAHSIQEFKLGHQEAVVNIAIINKGYNLLSISAEGTLKLWKMKDKRELASWNIFAHMQEKERKARDPKNEVIRMRATDTVAEYHVAVLISGFQVMPVFEVDGIRKKMRLAAHIQVDSDWCDLAWAHQTLFVFAPELNAIKRYYVSEFGLAADPRTFFYLHTSTKLDMHAYADYNRPFFPIKKRVATDILETVAGAREALLLEFGPITEDESKPVTLPRDAISLTVPAKRVRGKDEEEDEAGVGGVPSTASSVGSSRRSARRSSPLKKGRPNLL